MTFALEGGATDYAVVKALGHRSFEMTKTHYAGVSSVSSVSSSESDRVATALPGSSRHNELDELLHRLS